MKPGTINILWLDDVRNPFAKTWRSWMEDAMVLDCNIAKIHWVRNYEGFVQFFQDNDVPDVVCFDHDLGEEKTGYDCMKYMCDYCIDNNIDVPICLYQTNNPVGKTNMMLYKANIDKFFYV